MRKALSYLAAAIVSMGLVSTWGCSANKTLVKSQVDTAKASVAGIEEVESSATMEDGGEETIDSSNTSEGVDPDYSIIKDKSPDKVPPKPKKKKK